MTAFDHRKVIFTAFSRRFRFPESSRHDGREPPEVPRRQQLCGCDQFGRNGRYVVRAWHLNLRAAQGSLDGRLHRTQSSHGLGAPAISKPL